MIIDSLVRYFEDSPFMESGKLNVDYLPPATEEGVGYSISAVPMEETIKLYKDGSALCRFSFVIESRQDYGPDVAQNIINTGFGENLSHWLRQQSRKRNLPVLDNGLEARKIYALSVGYLYRPDTKTGRYQISCVLEFYRNS